MRRDGTAYPQAAARDGVRLDAARTRKERKYPELLHTRRCKLVVCAMKVGALVRESLVFLLFVAKAKARGVPAALQKSTEYCYLRRWSTMLAVSAQTAFAASLLGEATGKTPAHADVQPALGEVLCDRGVPTEGPSRLV